MSNNINDGSYNAFDAFDSFAYTLVKYLLENDELVWKLIKYNDADAWQKPNLSSVEKAELIYKGTDDTSKYRVFMDIGQPDVVTAENCVVKISPYTSTPDNRTVSTVNIMFEVYSHYKINHLSNYKTRIDMITQRFFKVFNGKDVGGIGKLFYDKLGSYDDRGEWGGQIPFRGRWIIMSTKIG